MDRFLSTHIGTRSKNPATDERKELLIDIFPRKLPNQPTLLFRRREPTSAWERFTNWLLRPIQRIKARDHIKNVLNAAKEKDTTLAELVSVKALDRELESSSLLRGISIETARTALRDLAIRGYYDDQELGTEVAKDIEDTSHHRKVFESQPTRIAGNNSEKQPPTGQAKEEAERNAALNTLRDLLPKSEHQGIVAFQEFLSGGSPESPNVFKGLLEEFIVRFADLMPMLDDNTIIILIPDAIRAAKFVFPQEFSGAQDNHSLRLDQSEQGLQKLFEAIASGSHEKANIAKACSYELMHYHQATAEDQAALLHEPLGRLKLYYAMYSGFELLPKLDPKDRPAAEAGLSAMLGTWRDLAPHNISVSEHALSSKAKIQETSETAQAFRGSTDISLDELYKHYAPYCANDTDLQRGLIALVNFAKHPDGTVNISEIVSVNNFMSQLGSRRNDDPGFQSFVSKIYDDYIEVPLSHPTRVTEADSAGRQVPILTPKSQKSSHALGVLYRSLPAEAKQAIDAFQDFLSESTRKPPGQATSLLKEFIAYFANYPATLDSDVVDTLLPEVMRCTRIVYPEAVYLDSSEKNKTKTATGQSPISIATPAGEEYQLSEDLARDLIRYIATKTEVLNFEEEIHDTKQQLEAIDGKKRRRLNRQNLLALRKRRVPGNEEKKATLKLATAWQATHEKLARLEAELADVNDENGTLLRDPAARLVLLYATRHPEVLLQYLGEEDWPEARKALEELKTELISPVKH